MNQVPQTKIPETNKVNQDSQMAQSTAPSFVKLAMKNMVRKGNQSLFHFGLTTIGFLGFILLIASLARPNLPQG